MMAPDGDSTMLQTMETLALIAGQCVMRFYRDGCAVETKSDLSPVTAADREAEIIILDGLRSAFPNIPIVAEEEMAQGVSHAALGSLFFLVDPLDGTREFINGHGDFTVNIALIRDGMPIAGVVYAPVSRKLYSGACGRAEAVTIDADHQPQHRHSISVRPRSEKLTIVASRSHRNAETDRLMTSHPNAAIVEVGSSLKFCMIAAGDADYYPRCGPTMQWDTAAGDAVLRAAGGSTTQLNGKPLTYGLSGDGKPFANPHFIAEGRR